MSFLQISEESFTKHDRYLSELISLAENEAREWHTAINEYERDVKLKVTGDTTRRPFGESVVLTDLKDQVDLMGNVLANAKLLLTLKRPGDTMTDREKAEAIEQYVHHALKSIDQRRGRSVRRQLTKMLLRLSASFLHWTYNPNPLAGLERL
jgi:hypothetical protein